MSKPKLLSLQSELDARTPSPPLIPAGTWNSKLSAQILELEGDRLLKALLLLRNDDLDAAHELVQHDSDGTGALIHAILHRREGDYDNAKYWYQAVGEHPFYDRLRELFPKWKPGAFVNQCAAASEPQVLTSLERIQDLELRLLTEWLTSQDRTD